MKGFIGKTGNISTFCGCEGSYDDAKIVIFGAPFDSTTSNRPGARFGPGAMRAESWGIETYSPYRRRDLEHAAVYDAGDLELPFGCPKPGLAMIEAAVDELLADGKLPVMLGGEHLVTLGAVKAAARKYPNLHIIHLDAHADLRQDYLGAELSHATVMRRCHDILGDGRIFQYGIRSGTAEEFAFAETYAHTHMHKFDIAALRNFCGKDKPVYFTLDLDVLDPSVLPGTGTPEAGGISFNELMQGLDFLSGLNIVGCDVVELAPTLDASGISTATACKILRELILAIQIKKFV